MTERQQQAVRWVGQIADDLYEEWIAHPDKRDFVLHKEQSTYAYKQGWFRSGWTGSAEDVVRLQRKAP